MTDEKDIACVPNVEEYKKKIIVDGCGYITDRMEGTTTTTMWLPQFDYDSQELSAIQAIFIDRGFTFKILKIPDKDAHVLSGCRIMVSTQK